MNGYHKYNCTRLKYFHVPENYFFTEYKLVDG